ncbi:response regulator transcription factor [Chryseobacterium wangxinyae]|uniref:response regulator transcription factor n=1 Tax=Chryseobacterium sp. CY350 TaxID=2997336 RepID=UPI00226EC000|nr:response regulator transcription factor [Chryseobacterium sp. CY350]MCY0978053.1 response regulator transcription factor [Chryseobacterium sp. CY350]WBZ95140.1 response regulator transcription factor [Chryseobacterium sp. CY350]
MKPDLAILDEPLLYTESLSKLLIQEKIFNSVNVFNSCENLYSHLRENTPQFLMISSNILLLSDLYKCLETIISQDSTVRIIVIGNSYDVIVIRKLFNKGIKSYLDKNSNYDEFLKSVNALSMNEIYICEHAKKMMINFISSEQEKQSPNIKEPLTRREMEILKLICDGYSSKDIGEKLFISINTVETHRKRILMKLNVKNSVGVVKYAMENNIFS